MLRKPLTLCWHSIHGHLTPLTTNHKASCRKETLEPLTTRVQDVEFPLFMILHSYSALSSIMADLMMSVHTVPDCSVLKRTPGWIWIPRLYHSTFSLALDVSHTSSKASFSIHSLSCRGVMKSVGFSERLANNKQNSTKLKTKAKKNILYTA